jgi:hypothetical protein
MCVYVHIEELCIGLMKEVGTFPETLEISSVLTWLITHGDCIVELQLSLCLTLFIAIFWMDSFGISLNCIPEFLDRSVFLTFLILVFLQLSKL